jgi:hypothetical protein
MYNVDYWQPQSVPSRVALEDHLHICCRFDLLSVEALRTGDEGYDKDQHS